MMQEGVKIMIKIVCTHCGSDVSTNFNGFGCNKCRRHFGPFYAPGLAWCLKQEESP